MYIPRRFKAFELVPRETYLRYKSHGDTWLIEKIFDERILIVADSVRDRFGPTTVNNWYYSGTLSYRGFRPPETKVGGSLSQHRFGRALDMNVKNVDSEDIRKFILKNQHAYPWSLVGGIELDVSWLHVDVRQKDADGKIRVFHP